MHVLVTGGAGFIGSHIVDSLVKEKYVPVIIDNLSTGKLENLNKEARFYEMDICDPEISTIFQKEKIEFVIHHAAQIDVCHSIAEPEEDARINIQGLLNLLKNSLKYDVKGFIFASSVGIIGEPNILPVKETHPKNPISPYGVSKLTSENYLFCFLKTYNLPYISLRYGNVYGPRQDPYGEGGVIAIFGQKMLKNEVPIIYGDGEQLRDYVYIDDVVEANMLALKKLIAGIDLASINQVDDLAYNIGTGKGTSVNELYNMLKNITEYRGKPEYCPPRQGELKQIYLEISKAKRELGWEPKVDLKEGLEKTIDSLK